MSHRSAIPAGPEPLWPSKAPCPDESGVEDQPTYTKYLLETGKPTGCVVVCPGGGYGGRAPHESGPIAEWLNSFGVSAIVADYRVAPHRHPVPWMDASRAVRRARCRAREWNIRPDRIGILGFSAGGHLASTVATHFDAGNPAASDPVERVSSRPDAAILCYPVITFGEFRHHGSMVNLIGENPSADLREFLSSEKQVTPATPPTFLWHTADDDAVPVENSLLFAAALRRWRVPFELHVFPSGSHGLGLAPDHPHVAAWTGLCETWLRRLGFA